MPNRWTRWGIYFGFWTLLGLLNAGSAVIERLDDPGTASWEPVLWEMSSLYTTGLLCPIIVFFVRRYPFSRHNWHRLAAAHMGGMVLFSVAHTTGMVGIRKTVYWLAGASYSFGDGSIGLRFLYEFYKDVTLYWIIVFLALGFTYYSKYRQQQLEASQLETRLIEAELENLKNQLNPHFFFNTLHMISSLVHEDPDRADEMITRLSELLRLALQNTSQSEITLREELEALELYLEIMRGRFEGRFEANLDVGPDALDARVPSLILQPLVENAFRHGIDSGCGGGAIEVTARTEGNVLRLAVRDNGPGATGETGSSGSPGIGLFNTGERLRHLYGERQSIRAGNLEAGTRPEPFDRGGFEVELTLPLQRERVEAGT